MNVVLEAIPPLCIGDQLTRHEFLARWENEPLIKCAELIGGTVYMPSPISIDHGNAESDVGMWLGYYRAKTPGTDSGHNATTFLLEDVPQPDLHLRVVPECGGAAWVEGKYLYGPPELVVEICQTSAAYDLHQKLDLYRDAGVREYLAVLLFEREIRWHSLEGGAYRELAADKGVWRSIVFPGLWLNGPAMLARQMDGVLATLQEGLASAEHADFASRLSARLANP